MTTPSFTAKVQISSKQDDDQADPVAFVFQPDYGQGRNAEWAAATPALALSMSIKKELADRLRAGQRFTVTFTPEDEDDSAAEQDY